MGGKEEGRRTDRCTPHPRAALDHEWLALSFRLCLLLPNNICSTCSLGITYTEMEKHTFTELTGNKFVYKETDLPEILKETKERGIA